MTSRRQEKPASASDSHESPDDELDASLNDSFPASDPPSITAPHSDDAKESKGTRESKSTGESKGASRPSGNAPSGTASGARVHPGDAARPGTPGTGENLCPDCSGSGVRDGQRCETCGGTGKIIAGVGGG